MTHDILAIARPLVSVSDQVVIVVREAIATGLLAPGQRLTEREMMQRTGAGRASIREAMSQLRSCGLIEDRPGGGLQVATLERSKIDQIYELRAAVEPMAAELFAARATQAEIVALVQAQRPSHPTRHGNTSGLSPRTHSRFSDLLFEGARSPMLLDVMMPFYVRIEGLRRLSLAMPGRYLAAAAELRVVLEAIQARECGHAAEAMRIHVAAAHESAIAAMSRAAHVGLSSSQG